MGKISINENEIFQNIQFSKEEKEDQQNIKLSAFGINNEIINEEAEESSSESIDIK
jgi:hypothetical protein